MIENVRGNTESAGQTKLTAIAITDRSTGKTHNVFVWATHDSDGKIRISQEAFSNLLTKLGVQSYWVH